jgi:hypothetical protein
MTPLKSDEDFGEPIDLGIRSSSIGDVLRVLFASHTRTRRANLSA